MTFRISMIAAGFLLSTSAFGQTATAPSKDDATTPAIATPGSNTSAAPVAGANSFTEAQARERLSKAGYSDVSALAKDDKGIWRGMANKAGVSAKVALDFQGNVSAE